VPRPLAPDESCEFMLTALSRGARGGAGAVFRPAMLGRFAGGGGAGLAFAAATVADPFVGAGLDRGAVGGGGGGVGRGAGGTCSSRYASGVQP
jgi:hypothetical protein